MGVRRLLLVVVVALVTLASLVAGPVSADAEFADTGSFEWVEQANLQIPDATFDLFVDTSDDRVIVGAPSFGDNTGAAYVYRFNGLEWVEEARLEASDAAVGDWSFGSSVALLGSIAVVGAPFNDSQGEDAGAVYVFSYDGTSWTEQVKLVASDAAAGHRFGRALDLSAERLVVGAPGNGAAYVFETRRDRWRQQAILQGVDGGFLFGWDVATSGDIVAVGGSLLEVFELSRGQWRATEYFSSPDADHDFFRSVAVSGETIVAGSSISSVDEIPGAAYVYTFQRGRWQLDTTLVSPDGVGLDFFGHDVAIDDDTVAVSAPCDFCASYAYTFTLSQGVWMFETRISTLAWQSLSLLGDRLVVGTWGGIVDIFNRQRTN